MARVPARVGARALAMKGTDAMRRASRWVTAVGSSFLLAAGAVAAPPAGALRPEPAPAAPTATPTDPELQQSLEKLSALSERIVRDAQSPQVWRLQLEQAEVLMNLAVRSKSAAERDRWMRMGVDSYYSASCSSPPNDTTAAGWLVQLPGRITQNYPDCPVATYAALQSVYAEYNRTLARDGGDPGKAQAALCENLLLFARNNPQAPEAAQAVLEAGHNYEQAGKKDDARRCYHHLMDHFAGNTLARKAGGALWRMGLGGEVVDLRLPALYGSSADVYDIKDLRGQLVLVYFWTSQCPRAAADIQALKELSDRYRRCGLEVVQVNLDAEPGAARSFLAGRLTAGTHLYQKGGLDSDIAVHYGIGALPETFLVGKDGALVRHGRVPTMLDADLHANLPRPGK
jgi:thiol-disulfide isomerase/thioredoxin